MQILFKKVPYSLAPVPCQAGQPLLLPSGLCFHCNGETYNNGYAFGCPVCGSPDDVDDLKNEIDDLEVIVKELKETHAKLAKELSDLRLYIGC